jgi:hypothetical protein
MNKENNICKMDGKYYADIISWISVNGSYALEECIVNSARAFYLNMMNERIDSERWKARHRLKHERDKKMNQKRNIKTLAKKRKLTKEEVQEIKDEIDKEYFNKYEVISVMLPDAPECIDRYLKNYFEDLCGYQITKQYINIKVRLPIKENKDNMGVN